MILLDRVLSGHALISWRAKTSTRRTIATHPTQRNETMLRNPTKRMPPSARRDQRRTVGYLHQPEVNMARSHVDELLGTVSRTSCEIRLQAVLAEFICSLPNALWIRGSDRLSWGWRTSCSAMRLVDDLFDICAGGLGKLSLRKEMVSVVELVARTAETARRVLAGRQHRLTVSTAAGVHISWRQIRCG